MLVLFDIDFIAKPFVLAKTQEHSLVLRSFFQTVPDINSHGETEAFQR